MPPDWSQAPTDILSHILQRLPITPDRIRFRAVCLSWRSAAALNPFPPPPQIPWLMLPNTDPITTSTHLFYSLTENRKYQIHLPQIQTTRIIGSSEGYLIYVDDKADLHLFNPISRSSIDLPPIATVPDLEAQIGGYIYRFPPPYPIMTYDLIHIREKFFTKVILSPGSSPGSYLAAAIFKAPAKLAVARAGDESWTTIQMPFMSVKDIIFHNGLLYAVNYLGKIVACDLTDFSSPRVDLVMEGLLQPLPLKHASKYLVVSSGELLQVWRLVSRSRLDTEEKAFCTRSCVVLRMGVGGSEWVEVESLGDHALFLGQNCSVSLSTVDFPDLRGNSIYFTDDLDVGANTPRRGRDMGVYNLEDKTIEPLWSWKSELNWSLPVWFTPTLP